MFSVTGMQGFQMFNLEHNVTLAVFFLTCLVMVLFRRKLINYKPILKWFIFISLVACEISMHVWLVLTHQWDIGDLPLHLCSLSTFIALYLLVNKKEKAFNLLYFIGIIPPILSMITPDMVYHFPHFRFIKYFLHHSVIPIAVLYFILFEGYRVPRKAIINSFVIVNIIAVPIFTLNYLLGTNFFYLANPTETETLLNFFGSGIMYYINLEIVALVVFAITYIPMAIVQKRENKKNSKETTAQSF
ncbi:TIGR02206 family membrane protein [Bacillus suaedaesalsae]|uniref:TIGR02206 family membrane protein n=1 Tax=Bacillus suaedaesalsae TaxID=2810349 RepID=A0ABS2DD28_9BACI|nr:TIGR02206 family membrane protein [Bacillus suaedaesalsae]MBM6616353.1 TIGR02206 family membrane protein [Bacillus suaedaesalsae]